MVNLKTLSVAQARVQRQIWDKRILNFRVWKKTDHSPVLSPRLVFYVLLDFHNKQQLFPRTTLWTEQHNIYSDIKHMHNARAADASRFRGA